MAAYLPTELALEMEGAAAGSPARPRLHFKRGGKAVIFTPGRTINRIRSPTLVASG